MRSIPMLASFVWSWTTSTRIRRPVSTRRTHLLRRNVSGNDWRCIIRPSIRVGSTWPRLRSASLNAAVCPNASKALSISGSTLKRWRPNGMLPRLRSTGALPVPMLALRCMISLLPQIQSGLTTSSNRELAEDELCSCPDISSRSAYQAFYALKENSIITSNNKSGYYHITFGLFQNWISFHELGIEEQTWTGELNDKQSI